MPHRSALFRLTLILFAATLQAEAAEVPGSRGMGKLPLSELMGTKVYSASKHYEAYRNTAAAIYIITNEDIRRAGARSIPEALRLAPGVEVQQANANMYAISIRGQNDLFSDKLLVLMDGRPLYSPTFSGVWWVAQNYPLSDIERIEVLRGPSGAVWGSNAVSGVINIITRSAEKTQGAHITAGTGTEEQGFGSLRLGGRSGQAAWRGYVMSEKRDGGIDPVTGRDTIDNRRFTQGGFRLDWDRSATAVTLQGDAYTMKAGSFGVLIRQPGQPLSSYRNRDGYTGHNLMARVSRQINAQTALHTRLFYDHYGMDNPIFGEQRDTYDAETQLDVTLLPWNRLSLGANYRISDSRVRNTPTLQLPDKRNHLASFRLNDEISLLDDRLKLIAGVRYERNDYTGWEVQPTARTIYTGDGWAIWAAASRSVRIPNAIENGLRFNVKGGPGWVGRLIGDGRATSEVVHAYETGIRLFPDDALLLQVTGFKLRYQGVSDAHQNTAAAFVDKGVLVIPVYLQNVLDGKAYGLEADLTWQPTKWFKLHGACAFLNQHYYPRIPDREATITAYTVSQQSPPVRYNIGIGLNPLKQLEIDANLYYYDTFRQQAVTRYNRLDARIGWRPDDHLTLSFTGKNLLQQTHKEDINYITQYASLIQQSYFVTLEYDFD